MEIPVSKYWNPDIIKVRLSNRTFDGQPHTITLIRKNGSEKFDFDDYVFKRLNDMIASSNICQKGDEAIAKYFPDHWKTYIDTHPDEFITEEQLESNRLIPSSYLNPDGSLKTKSQMYHEAKEKRLEARNEAKASLNRKRYFKIGDIISRTRCGLNGFESDEIIYEIKKIIYQVNGHPFNAFILKQIGGPKSMVLPLSRETCKTYHIKYEQNLALYSMNLKWKVKVKACDRK